MKRLLTLVLAMAGLFALLQGPALASPAGAGRRIAACTAQGQFAICDAAGNARHHPVTIVVHVRATPVQSVFVAWDITCAKGSGAGSSSGHFRSGTPVNRKLHHPYKHPDNCIVSADAQLARGGHLHLWLTYTS
ncbi:MAG TPA: hypothetical protein VMU94_13115 [Streptosporangiaceae bacterium]|nr:hypothetical protein [Streptosporangiaceae bacterium]